MDSFKTSLTAFELKTVNYDLGTKYNDCLASLLDFCKVIIDYKVPNMTNSDGCMLDEILGDFLSCIAVVNSRGFITHYEPLVIYNKGIELKSAYDSWRSTFCDNNFK